MIGGGKKTVIFWVFSLVLFSMPFVFYGIHQQQRKPSPIALQATEVGFGYTGGGKTKVGVTIYIQGALERPGIYKIRAGTKVYELIEQLDLYPNAVVDHLNMAKVLRDGQKIVIKEQAGRVGVVNINFATEEELMALPGIGKVWARIVIEYRKQHGAFKSFSDVEKIDNLPKKVKSTLKYAVTY